MSDKVYISSQDNNINLTTNDKIIVITDSDQNQITVTQPVTSVIEVNTPGPKGQPGEQGPSGSQGPPGDELFTELSASLYFTTSSLQVTGSISVTGGISGSFSGSGVDLFDIPATAITGLNLSQIASGSYTASISPDAGFVVNTSASILGSLEVTNSITGSSITGVDYIDFDPTATEIQPSLARISWNQTDKTLEIGTGDGDTTLQLGQEIVYPPVVNKDSINLIQGTLVMVDPTDVAQGNRLRVIRAVTDGTYPSQLIVGILTEDINKNNEGFATWFGYVRNLSLNDLQPIGETWLEGQILYPDPNIPGGLTNIKPVAPAIDATIAAITRITGINLTLLVRPTLTFTLDELNNVTDSGSINGDLLVKSGSVWITGKSLFGSYIVTGSLIISGSSTFTNIGPAVFSGSVGISGSTFSTELTASSVLIPGNVTVLGTASINTLIVNQTKYSSGSNQLGDGIEDTQTLFGTVRIPTGSLTITGSTISTEGFTGSLFGTASFSNTSSLSILNIQSQTASFAPLYTLTSSFNNFTSSYNDDSSSFNTRITNNSSSISFLSSSFISFSGSFRTGSYTGSFTGDGSGLTDVPASSIVGLNLSQIASGSATASISPDNGFQVNTLASFQGSISASEFTGSGLGITNARIGLPTDGTYNDGFFDTFTTATKLSDALDEISLAFLDLAPAKASVLTGTNLTRFNPAVFTGNLSAGLNPQWYATASAFTQYTTLTSATNVDLRANGTRAGKASDISASLFGGVSSSRAYGTNAFSVVDIRPLSSGLGSTNTIDIDGLRVFNTFWAIVTSSIDDTINQTGSVQYRVSADNGAGITNAFQYFYVGGASDYPNQTLSGGTSVTSSVTFNYLSGIEYLRTANFAVSFTGSNLFDPVYNLNQCSLASSFFTTLNTGSNTPQYNDVLRLTANRSLLATTHSGQANPTCTITATKPGKSNATLAVTLSNTKINSYTSPVSTNSNNSQTDVFVDEARRYTNLNTAGFASGSTLTDGNLQVQNARLIVGRWGDYGAFLSGSTSAATTYANYFRDSIPGTTNRIGGTFSLLRNTNAFAASTPISAWGSGGRLEAVLVLKADITGPETANFYYDLGRAVGANSGNIIGIRNTITTNNTTTYTVTWALPGGVSTGANGCVIWIRYRNTPNTDFIRSLTITYS
jgi:hypothetical protein